MKKGSCLPIVFSQVIYSGGYSDGEPPLPIPNREAKPVIADGTARPGGRVGSRRALKESSDERSSGDSFSCLWVCEEMPCRTFRFQRSGNDVLPRTGNTTGGIDNYPVCLRHYRQSHSYSYPSFSIFEYLLVLPLSLPYGHVFDDRLSFDPLER